MIAKCGRNISNLSLLHVPWLNKLSLCVRLIYRRPPQLGWWVNKPPPNAGLSCCPHVLGRTESSRTGSWMEARLLWVFHNKRQLVSSIRSFLNFPSTFRVCHILCIYDIRTTGRRLTAHSPYKTSGYEYQQWTLMDIA